MSESGQGSGWVVEPPATGAFMSLDVADDAELTPELRQALDMLVQAISEPGQGEEEEAEAEAFQVFKPRCKGQMKCDPYTVRPCVARTIHECVIVDCPSYVKPTLT